MNGDGYGHWYQIMNSYADSGRYVIERLSECIEGCDGLRCSDQIMRKNSLDEEGAVKRIINLSIQDYVADLYKDGEISIREAADILQLNFRQTFEILEKKVGGNVEA